MGRSVSKVFQEVGTVRGGHSNIEYMKEKEKES